MNFLVFALFFFNICCYWYVLIKIHDEIVDIDVWMRIKGLRNEI